LFPKYPRPSQQPCNSPDVFFRLGYCNFQLGAAPPGIIQLGGAVLQLMGQVPFGSR
jgi:hypothetical protein